MNTSQSLAKFNEVVGLYDIGPKNGVLLSFSHINAENDPFVKVAKVGLPLVSWQNI